MLYDIFDEYYERGATLDISESERDAMLKRNDQLIAIDHVTNIVYATKETAFFHKYENVQFID